MNGGRAVTIGITGHQRIPGSALRYVRSGVARALRAAADPIGVTSLAAGADQIFAEEVLKASGRLRVVLPCAGYEAVFGQRDLARYRRLLASAEQVEQLSFAAPSEEAFLAAGRRVVDVSDALVAVWDGQPARGMGGTADIVAYAKDCGRSVTLLWPAGVVRPTR